MNKKKKSYLLWGLGLSLLLSNLFLLSPILAVPAHAAGEESGGGSPSGSSTASQDIEQIDEKIMKLRREAGYDRYIKYLIRHPNLTKGQKNTLWNYLWENPQLYDMTDDKISEEVLGIFPQSKVPALQRALEAAEAEGGWFSNMTQQLRSAGNEQERTRIFRQMIKETKDRFSDFLPKQDVNNHPYKVNVIFNPELQTSRANTVGRGDVSLPEEVRDKPGLFVQIGPPLYDLAKSGDLDVRELFLVLGHEHHHAYRDPWMTTRDEKVKGDFRNTTGNECEVNAYLWEFNMYRHLYGDNNGTYHKNIPSEIMDYFNVADEGYPWEEPIPSRRRSQIFEELPPDLQA